jgi:hypothetical protein
MGYVLLWIENLAVSLLLVAMVFSCVGRLRRRWLRDALWMPIPVVFLLWYALLIYLATELTFFGHNVLPANWFGAVVALAASFLVGIVWLRRRGLRRIDDETKLPMSATWPRGKLTIALGVAVALHLMTYWNLDLAVRQQAENLRSEAAALALSVAPPRIADSDNAAILYEQTYEALRPLAPFDQPSPLDEFGDPTEPKFDSKNAALRKLLKDYSAVLRLLREAAQKPNCYFEHDYAWPTLTTLLPEAQYLGKAATLLALDARVNAADGNVRAAVDDINAMFAMSRHVRTAPILVCVLLSFAIEHKATATFQNVLLSSKLSEDDLRLLQLPLLRSHQSSVEWAARGDEACRLATYCDFGRGQLTWRLLMECCGRHKSDAPFDGDLADSAASSLYRVFLFADDLAEHRRLSQEMRLLAAMPYYRAATRWDDFEAPLSGGRGMQGMLNRLLLPTLRCGYEAGAQADAWYQALRLGLAAERYRLRNGRLPARLDELTPDFIPVIPSDPFDGKPMKMKRVDRGLIVYSIGLDRVDNGGTPVARSKTLLGEPGKRTGDIVFEVPNRKP